MKTRPKQSPPVGTGSISAHEFYTMREAGRRLGWGVRLFCQLQAQGLRCPLVGRKKMVLGRDIIDFVSRLADAQQAGGDGQ